MSRREEILAGIEDIKLLSSPALQAVRLVNDPDFDLGELGRALSLDPALTTNLLRFSNSAYFWSRREIHTVEDAIIRLGRKNIARILYVSTAAKFSRPVKGYDLPEDALWKHLVSTAVATEILSDKTGISVPDGTFTAALLHDVGKLVLGTYLEVDSKPIRTLAWEENIPFDEAEQRVLGISHAEVGAALLEQWNLPETIVNAVRWHHNPEASERDKRMLDLVHVADALSMMAGNGVGIDGLSYSICPETEKRLDLSIVIIELVLSELMGEVEKICQVNA